MSFLSPRRLILSTLFVIAFCMPGHAETSERQTRLAAHLAGQMLIATADDKIILSPPATAALSQAGLSANRFQLESVDVLRNDNDGDEQAITFLAVYREETERRLWLVVRAWYDVAGDAIMVSRAEPYWNSPENPEVQLRLLPHDAVSDTPGAANTYAKSVAMLSDIVKAALDPDDPLPRSTDIAVVFIDRIAFDAQITVTSSAEPDGEPLWTVNMKRLDATGWPILLIDGSQLSGEFLQIRYRPGSDRDPAGAVSTIVAAYPISALRRQ